MTELSFETDYKNEKCFGYEKLVIFKLSLLMYHGFLQTHCCLLLYTSESTPFHVPS